MKGQRPISSFFFKKPEDKAGSSQEHVIAPPAAHEPPRKRQRKADAQQHVSGSNLQTHSTSARPADAQPGQQPCPTVEEPIDLTEAHSERPGQPSCGTGLGTSSSAQPGRPRYSVDAQHERFQNKLVLGPWDRDKTVVPQKTTPLEDQVYALKRKHPGILLLIEVRNRFPCQRLLKTPSHQGK